MDKLKELLAALLITRQVMGNIKESLIPYFKKEMKVAKLSFDLYGALSPTTATKNMDEDPLTSNSPRQKDRVLSQVELESSAPNVGVPTSYATTLNRNFDKHLFFLFFVV